MNILEIRFKNGEKKWFGDKWSFYINTEDGGISVSLGEHKESYSLNDVEKVLCGGEVIFGETVPLCPLTSCAHEKALVRVAERVRFEKYTVDEGQLREAIQTLCLCGKVLSSNEVKE